MTATKTKTRSKNPDKSLSPDVQAKALADEYAQLADQSQALKERMDEIKTLLADLLPDGGDAGDHTVQVSYPRRLDEKAFITAYPVTKHPELYTAKIAMAEVKRHVAPVDLDTYYTPGNRVVKVL